MRYYFVLIIMTFLGAVASLFLKRASGASDFKTLLLNWNLYVGGMLYLSSAVLNIYVLRYLDYSVVLPLTSITYIWTMVLSYLILKEKISVRKVFGVCLVIVGAFCVSFK